MACYVGQRVYAPHDRHRTGMCRLVETSAIRDPRGASPPSVPTAHRARALSGTGSSLKGEPLCSTSPSRLMLPVLPSPPPKKRVDM